MDFAVIKQFAHGGMSSGGVDNRWWTEEAIPLLKSRLTALRLRVKYRLAKKEEEAKKLFPIIQK